MTPDATANSSQRWHALTLLVAAALFMENLDGTILTTAIPKMAVSLGVRPVNLSIAVTVYLVTLGVLIPLSGWMAERFGTRRVFVLALATFTLASALCAVSDTLPEIVAMRALQGVGGAMMVPVGRLAVLRSTDKADLVRAIALITWPGLAAPLVAPTLGGLLTTYASWRWIFVINVPLGIVALFCAVRLIPPGSGDTERASLDVRGFVLTGVSLALLVGAAQSMTGGAIAWVPIGAASLIGGGLGTAAIIHLNHTQRPLLDLSVNSIATFRTGMTSGSLFRLAISAVPLLLTLQFQNGLQWSPVHSGSMLIALFAGNIAIKPLTTPILRRASFRTVLITSLGIGSAALAGCACFGHSTPEPVIASVLFVSGVCRSVAYTAYNTIVFADVPHDRMSSANTLQSTVQQLTVGLGVAFGALALRGGTPLAHAIGANSPLAPYSAAFIMAAALLLAACATLQLRSGAGASLGIRSGPRPL